MANFKGITLPDGTTYFPEGSGSAIDTVSVSVDNNTGVPSATGSVSGTTLNLDFKNLKGETGSQGPAGATGATPNIQIGDVTTLQPDQQATASITGTPENPLLNLGIPQGQAGGNESYTLETVNTNADTLLYQFETEGFNQFIFMFNENTSAGSIMNAFGNALSQNYYAVKGNNKVIEINRVGDKITVAGSRSGDNLTSTQWFDISSESINITYTSVGESTIYLYKR